MAKKNQPEIQKDFSVQAFSYAKLESLLTVANVGSVTAAANKLHREASSVSRHIQDLEKFFGCKLRRNIGKTTGLSPEGEELVGLLRRQITELQNFRDKHTKNLNSVSLAAGDSLLHLILLPQLPAIQSLFNRTTISVSALRTFEIIQGLQNFSIDLGILKEASVIKRSQDQKNKDASLDYKSIGEYKYATFVPRALWPKEEIIEKEIFNLSFAMIKDHWDIDFFQLAQNDGIPFGNIRVYCQNFTQVFRLVRLGHYAGILPAFCKKLLPPDTICVEPDFLKRQSHKIVLAWNCSLLKTKTSLQPFIDSFAIEQEK